MNEYRVAHFSTHCIPYMCLVKNYQIFKTVTKELHQLTESVLPEPVCAMPTTSCPLSAVGQPWAWIGVGWVQFWCCNTCCTQSTSTQLNNLHIIQCSVKHHHSTLANEASTVAITWSGDSAHSSALSGWRFTAMSIRWKLSSILLWVSE